MARAWVNNGGDIALHLAPDQSVRVGLYADLARLQVQELMQGLNLDGAFEVTHAMPVRGVATSGWRGRSFSLGIADSVTVLAATAAQADAAASSFCVRHPAVPRHATVSALPGSLLATVPVTDAASTSPLSHNHVTAGTTSVARCACW